MKKILLLILALSLVGCNKVEPIELIDEPNPEDALILSDEQTEQLDKLIYTGGYFDDVVESQDEIFYSVGKNAIHVQLSGLTKIEIDFNLDGIASYSYTFNPVKLDYNEEGTNKTAQLNSVFIRTEDYANSKITSSLVTNDDVSYDICFNQANYKIENNNDATKSSENLSLPDSLNNKLFDIYTNQWNTLTAFDSFMQLLNKQINDLVMNFDSYSYRNRDSLTLVNNNQEVARTEINAPATTYEFTDFPYSANNHNYLYWYTFNGEPKKTFPEASAFERTLFLFFFLNSRDSFSIDELSSAFLTVDSQYYCYNGFCSTNKDEVNQGKFREHEFSLMTLDYFNQCINDVFGLNPYTSLDKYKYLDSGVYVSQSDQTLMSDMLSGPWDIHYHGASVDYYNESGIDYVTFTPYIAQYGDCRSGQECTYDLYTTEVNFVKGSIPESKVNDYVVNNKSKFFTWDITLAPGSNPDFYQVLSYEQK